MSEPTETPAKSSAQEAEGSEWGWDHTPLESEDSYGETADRTLPPLPQMLDNSMHSQNNQAMSPPNRSVTKKSMSETKLQSNHSSSNVLSKGMTSSPSFQELEKAIGQTLALGLNNSESSSSLNSEYQYGYGGRRMSLQRSRSFGKQQQIFRPYSNAPPIQPMPNLNARQELDPFVNEYESRALILFHSPTLNPITVRNAAQKCGVLYYIRPEFHSRYGVTLLSYFDLRAAILAQNTLARELAPDGQASAHFSVMLHAGAGTNSEEFRLVVSKVPSEYSEKEVESRFSQFGELRSIKRVYEGENDESEEAVYSVEYYNIQDARLAASELSATIGQFWGPRAEISFAPLDSRKQTLCRQLLATLSRWRAELAAVATYQPPMMMGAAAFPGQYGDGRGMMMMMPPQQMTPAFYPPSPYSMSPTHSPMVYQPPMDYGVPIPPPLSIPDSSQQYYPQQMGMTQPYPETTYGWQQPVHSTLTPHMQHTISQPGKYNPSQSTQKASQISYSQQDRPLHHNGGHGFNRKSRSSSQSTTDAEFVIDLRKLSIGEEPADKRTTLMVWMPIYFLATTFLFLQIRNIPNKYSQQMLLDEINVNHEGKYDFFYLPIDFKNRCNVGYAFISFLDPLFIPAFVREFEGQRWSNFNSDKVCSISYARIQGKAAMISRFQNSSLLEKDDEYRPLLFYSDGPNKGKPEPFPAATRRTQRQVLYDDNISDI